MTITGIEAGLKGRVSVTMTFVFQLNTQHTLESS